MTCNVENLGQRFSRLFLCTKYMTTQRSLESVKHPYCRNRALLKVVCTGHSVITEFEFIITVVAWI